MNLESTHLTHARSTFLFTLPTYLDGFAEVFNLAGTNHVRYAVSHSPAAADSRATRQDWAATGDDVRGAMHRVRV